MIKILSILLLLANLSYGQLLLRNGTLASYRMVYAPTNVAAPEVQWITSTPTGTPRVDNYWVGCAFTTPATNIVITALGRWVVAGNTNDHRVVLRRESNNAYVCGVTVPTLGLPVGWNRVALTNEVVLDASTDYYIMSDEYTVDSWYDIQAYDVSTGVLRTGAYGGIDSANFFGTGSYVPLNFWYKAPKPWQTSNLVLFAEAESVAGSAGTLVSTLPDQSANGYNLSQVNDTLKPILTNNASVINGKKFAMFNANSKYMTNVFMPLYAQPLTYFFVVKWRFGGTVPFLFDSQDPDNRNVAYFNSYPLFGAGTDMVGDGITEDRWMLIEAKFNGASSYIATNGVQFATGNVGAQSLHGFTLGARWAGDLMTDADIAALGIYGNLSDDSRALIRNYYRTNYALPIPSCVVMGGLTNYVDNDYWGFSPNNLAQKIQVSSQLSVCSVKIRLACPGGSPFQMSFNSLPDRTGTIYGEASRINNFTNAERQWVEFTFTNNVVLSNDCFLCITQPQQAAEWRVAYNIADGAAYKDTNYCAYRNGERLNAGLDDFTFEILSTP